MLEVASITDVTQWKHRLHGSVVVNEKGVCGYIYLGQLYLGIRRTD